LIEKIGVVLIAGTVRVSALSTPPAMYAHPWCREGPRVLDRHGNVNTIAVCRKLPPLYHMELLGMGRAVIIDKGPCRNSDGVNNQGIAIFVMANRFTVPRGLNVFRMERIQIDVANLGLPKLTFGTAGAVVSGFGNM